MNSTLSVQQALMCLEALEHHPGLSLHHIARQKGVPFADCRALLARLETTGIVLRRESGAYHLARALAEFTALDILQALWTPVASRPAFQLLYGPARGAPFVRTLQAAGRTSGAVMGAEG